MTINDKMTMTLLYKRERESFGGTAKRFQKKTLSPSLNQIP